MQANLMLLVTAAIWGFAFVAQRVAMDHMGPFSFNAVRFLLGAASLLPLIWFFSRKKAVATTTAAKTSVWLAGGVAGAILFIAAALQQVGLLYTTAAKAGFITGLYMILVPFLGLFLRHVTGLNAWLGALLALVGLYLLSINADFFHVTRRFSDVCRRYFLGLPYFVDRFYRPASRCVAIICRPVSGLWSAKLSHGVLAGNTHSGFCVVGLAGGVICQFYQCGLSLYVAGGGTEKSQTGSCRHYYEHGSGVCRDWWCGVSG